MQFFMIFLSICCYILSQTTIDARTTGLRKPYWSLSTNGDYQGDLNHQKRQAGIFIYIFLYFIILIFQVGVNVVMRYLTMNMMNFHLIIRLLHMTIWLICGSMRNEHSYTLSYFDIHICVYRKKKKRFKIIYKIKTKYLYLTVQEKNNINKI